MPSLPAKRIAVFVIGLLLAALLWMAWTRFGNHPAPTPSPIAAPPSLMTSESRPALPIMTAVKPMNPSPPPAKNSTKRSPVKPSRAASLAKPVSAPAPAAQVPSLVIPAPLPPPPVPLEWKGNDTSITHAGEVVIRNDHQWIQFWAEHHPHEAAPEVDFALAMVVGVFSGPRPADQFTIRIVEIRPLPDRLTVDYQERLPPPGTFAVDVTVYPYQLKVIPRTTLPVKFNKLAPINPNR